MPKPISARAEIYVSFIEDELKAGNATFSKVCTIFNNRFQKTQRTFARYWKTANERHLIYMAKVQKAKENKSITTEVNMIVGKVLTREERKVIASKIAMGVARKVGDKIIYPSDSERTKALEYLSKLDGDFVNDDMTAAEIFKKLAVAAPVGKNIAPPIRSEKDAKDFGNTINIEAKN